MKTLFLLALFAQPLDPAWGCPDMVVAQDPDNPRKDYEWLYDTVGDKMDRSKHESNLVELVANDATSTALLPLLDGWVKFFNEELGVEPEGKLNVLFWMNSKSLDEFAPKGTLVFFDNEKKTLHLSLTSNWRPLFARGMAEAWLSAINLSKPMPAAVRAGIITYLSSYNGVSTRKKFFDLSHGYDYMRAVWAKDLSGQRRLFGARRLGEWAVGVYLCRGKDQGAALKAALKAHKSGADPAWPTTVEAEVQLYWSGVAVKTETHEEDIYLVAESRNYTIKLQKGTSRPKPAMTDKQILDELKLRMDLIFDRYAAAFKVDDIPPARPVLMYFKDEAHYLANGGLKDALAHYSPSMKRVMAYEYADEKMTTFHVLAHEGCHQFFDLSFPGYFRSAEDTSWFTEGLAECLGSCEVKGKDLMIFTLRGAAAWNLPTIKQAVKEGSFTPLDKLFEMDYDQFQDKGDLHYAQSWSICHFLWNQRKESLVKLIEAFKAGKSRSDAYQAAFGVGGKPPDLGKLQAEWVAFVKRL